MKTILITFVVLALITFSHSTTINVPDSQSTIQAGIDVAVNGDTVMVNTGTYVENINFKGKNIVVGSKFLISGDTAFISQTIIDGNKKNTVVLFEQGENDAAILTGFTITNGKGRQDPPNILPADFISGGITCLNNSNPKLTHLKIIGNSAPKGGGISVRNSNPELENVVVYDNQADNSGGGIYCYDNANPVFRNMNIYNNKSNFHGGGIYGIQSSITCNNVFINKNVSNDGGGICCWDDMNLILENTSIAKNTAFERGGGVYGYNSNIIFNSTNRCNIYLNYSGRGSDLYVLESDEISVIVDTFTVISPTNDFASPIDSFSFDILTGKINQVSHDLYVSPDGDDNNSGFSATEPLKTITVALTKIIADTLNPKTIYLADGEYNYSSGEHFPLNMRDFVSLEGSSELGSIIDAEKHGSVLCFDSDRGITLNNFSITGGYATSGGAIYCIYSNPIFKYLMIYENEVVSRGGGIFCQYSSPHISNLTIYNNKADWGGGGIYCEHESKPIIENVTISRNRARYWAGGVYCENYAHPSLLNSILWNNLPHEIRLNSNGDVTIEYSDIEDGKDGIVYDSLALWGGTIYWLEGNIDENPLFCDPIIDQFTLAENSPCSGTGKDGQNMGAHDVACDSIFILEDPSVLYVSVTGSDETGTGAYDNPLATIQYAIDIAASGDSIIVYPGTYAENINLYKKDIVLGSLFIINDESSYISSTIIDGDSSGSVIFINSGDTTSVICGLTITNGHADEGGGIRCVNSHPTLTKLRITENTAFSGAGLSASSSNFKLANSTITNNISDVMGGGIQLDNSYPIFDTVIIEENLAKGSGGGCSTSSSVPYFKNVTIAKNIAYYNGGGISLQFSSAIFDSVERCNIYYNHAGRGSDIDFFNFDEDNASLKLFADTFTVINPTDYHLYRIDKFDILNGKINQTSNNLYVSPSGSDNNTGTSIDQPLKSISLALSKILADSLNPRTIFLAEGIYTPSGYIECFPLNMVDYVSIEGDTAENVLLDAKGLSGVLSINSDKGININNLTITGGFRFEGGGIYCENSKPKLFKAAITDNSAMSSGGGMYCTEDSYPFLEHCTISNNTSDNGGGIALYGSCISLLNTIVWKNFPDEIYFHGGTAPESCVEVAYTDLKDSTDKIITNDNGDVFWMEGNLNTNPQFCNAGNNIFTLAENSPCIGKANNGKNLGAFDIGCEIADIEYELEEIPTEFNLAQNKPNPFNPTTIISWQLPTNCHVQLNIYNIVGQKIKTLVSEIQKAGSHEIEWDASEFPSGIYFYRIQAGNFVQTKRMLFIK